MKGRTLWALHAWALLLDGTALILGGLLFSLSLPLWGKGFLALPLLFVLGKAVTLHGTVPRKYRAWQVLYNKNKKGIREESFQSFMGAPCGRSLVKDLCRELNQPALYAQLKKKYYRGFFAKDEESLVIIPYEEWNPENE